MNYDKQKAIEVARDIISEVKEFNDAQLECAVMTECEGYDPRTAIVTVKEHLGDERPLRRVTDLAEAWQGIARMADSTRNNEWVCLANRIALSLAFNVLLEDEVPEEIDHVSVTIGAFFGGLTPEMACQGSVAASRIVRALAGENVVFPAYDEFLTN